MPNLPPAAEKPATPDTDSHDDKSSSRNLSLNKPRGGQNIFPNSNWLNIYSFVCFAFKKAETQKKKNTIGNVLKFDPYCKLG